MLLGTILYTDSRHEWHEYLAFLRAIDSRGGRVLQLVYLHQITCLTELFIPNPSAEWAHMEGGTIFLG